MKTLEKEMNSTEGLAFLLPYLKNHENLKILDIGCGKYGDLLLEIYSLIPNNVSKLIGVDTLEDYDEDERNFDLDTIINCHNENSDNQILNINQIELILQDGFSFINNLRTNQDLIIFSNFLHLYSWDKSKELIQIALTKLTPSGIIYIKVRNKNKEFAENDNSNRFDMGNIEKIKSFSKILDNKEEGMFYKLVIKK